MLTLKIKFEDGNEICTRFNGTINDAVRHYIGNRFNLGVVEDDLQKAVEISFPSEEDAIYHGFCCTWKIDRIYLADVKTVKKFDLQYPVRFASHIIEAPDDYEGVREMDAGWRMTDRQASGSHSGMYSSIIAGLTEAVEDAKSGGSHLECKTICNEKKENTYEEGYIY